MFAIFNFIGSIFGYVLWAIYLVFQNFGVAIIIFTILTRLILFPTSIKQQKSMASNARMQAKQRELKEKYANNKAKYNEEVQKLYTKEGVSPFGGCLTSIFPMFIMLGIWYSVSRPLSNVLHIASDKMDSLLKFVNTIPGMSINTSGAYYEMDLVRLFSNPNTMDTLNVNGKGISSILSADEISRIQHLSGGFNFLGLNLLDIPQLLGFASAIILIPILVLVTSVGSQLLTMRMQSSMMGQQKGCMKVTMLLLPLISVWISYVVPGAVGFYWIWSTVIGFAQTVVINHFYTPMSITAKTEAQHVALMELKEAQVPRVYRPLSPVPAAAETAKTKKKKKK